MDICTTSLLTASSGNDTLHTSQATLCLSLQDLIDASPKSEELLEALTADQIQLIQETITKVKKRKLEKTKEAEDRAAAIASALAAAVTRVAATTTVSPIYSSDATLLETNVKEPSPGHEQTSHVQDGTEWLSFVYSHNRTMKRYSIRTDINNVSLDIMSDTFKAENCVYPRANLPQEQYRGNRWNYETECNLLGWKLAWVNADEIAGKRGLIQRAVDSYRNRYPSMRSRRVARQAKLMNGTLRKRKQREESVEDISMSTTVTHQPKTITIEDGANRIRIKIGIEHVNLNEITPEFRQCNCVYPRAMALRSDQAVGLYMRWMEEVKCNEMGWKLAWLNPRHLANKKNLLQRALDTYRSKFMPELRPRKHSSRSPPVSLGPAVLTTDNLRTLQAMDQKITSPTMSCGSGTTESLDFGDCFSVADVNNDSLTLPGTYCDVMMSEPLSLSSLNTSLPLSQPPALDETATTRTHSTSSSNATSAACTPSPPMNMMSDLYNFMADESLLMLELPSTAASDFDLKIFDGQTSSVDHLLRLKDQDGSINNFLC